MWCKQYWFCKNINKYSTSIKLVYFINKTGKGFLNGGN